jgi:hypothetical protein
MIDEHRFSKLVKSKITGMDVLSNAKMVQAWPDHPKLRALWSWMAVNILFFSLFFCL